NGLLNRMHEGTALVNALSTEIERANRLADPEFASRDLITKIAAIKKATSKEGRPGADVGDGSSEAALKHEAETGEPYKSPEGHWMKVRDSITGLADALGKLRRVLRQAADTETRRKIEAAIVDGQTKLFSLQSGMDVWNARGRIHPEKWDANGQSRGK